MESSLVLRSTQTATQEVTGRYKYIRYCDLKKSHGAAAAKLIRDEKRALQQKQDENPNNGQPPWALAHPDLPGSEATCQIGCTSDDIYTWLQV